MLLTFLFKISSNFFFIVLSPIIMFNDINNIVMACLFFQGNFCAENEKKNLSFCG